MHPLSMVEDEHFRAFVKAIDPRIALPCRKTLTHSLKTRNVLCAEAKAKLETELSLASFIALTADCWTPLTNASYKTVTAHYITRSLKWFRMFFLLWFSKSVTHRKTLQHIWKPSLKIRKFRKSKFQGLSRIMQQISRELYSVLPNSRDFSRFQGYLSRAWEKCRDSTKSGISPGILPIKIFFIVIQ